jgi:hypothetical protein
LGHLNDPDADLQYFHRSSASPLTVYAGHQLTAYLSADTEAGKLHGMWASGQVWFEGRCKPFCDGLWISGCSKRYRSRGSALSCDNFGSITMVAAPARPRHFRLKLLAPGTLRIDLDVSSNESSPGKEAYFKHAATQRIKKLDKLVALMSALSVSWVYAEMV